MVLRCRDAFTKQSCHSHLPPCSAAPQVPGQRRNYQGPLGYGLQQREQAQCKRPGAAHDRMGTSSWGESPELRAALMQQRGTAAEGLEAGAVVPRRRTDGDVYQKPPLPRARSSHEGALR